MFFSTAKIISSVIAIIIFTRWQKRSLFRWKNIDTRAINFLSHPLTVYLPYSLFFSCMHNLHEWYIAQFENLIKFIVCKFSCNLLCLSPLSPPPLFPSSTVAWLNLIFNETKLSFYFSTARLRSALLRRSQREQRALILPYVRTSWRSFGNVYFRYN